LEEAVLQQLLTYPVAPTLERDVRKVVETGEALVALDIELSNFDTTRGNSDYITVIRNLNPTSCITVPMKARGKALGALCVAMTNSRRRFAHSDVPVVQEIGLRAAIALDNAILYESAVESSRLKDQFLATLSHELRTP